MKAGEVMTRQVVSVRPDTPASSIALLLFKSGISAVPVIDENGAAIGMVSEGDLMPRDESEREARRDWWLKLLGEGEDLSPEYLQYLGSKDRAAREIMHSPVITVQENADLVEVAEILFSKKIKRVPVERGGRVVGIVSRADLVKAVAGQTGAPEFEPPLSSETEPFPSERLAALTRRKQPDAPARQTATSNELSAEGFRGLVAEFEQKEMARREAAQHQTAEKHQQEARQLLAVQLSEEAWHRMLNEARSAAGRGEREHLLLRFPCELCSDHGRAVNAPDPSWPTTLRGIAAQVFMRWKKELHPRGFGLHARIMDFPDGIPGDIGLFLAW